MMSDEHNAFTPRQAAKYLGISEAVLRVWRRHGEGPRHFKAGPKLVRYLRHDIDSWIASRLSNSGAPVFGVSTQVTAQQ